MTTQDSDTITYNWIAELPGAVRCGYNHILFGTDDGAELNFSFYRSEESVYLDGIKLAFPKTQLECLNMLKMCQVG